MLNHSRIAAIFSTALALHLCSGIVRAGESEELLELVRERHKATCQLIRTLSADVAAEHLSPEKKPWLTGRYWRSFDMVRIDEYPAGTNTIESHLLKNGVVRSVGRHRLGEGRFDRTGASRDSGASTMASVDLWSELLLDFFDSKPARYDYSAFLNLAKSKPYARKEISNGLECIRVDLSVQEAGKSEERYSFWHDPSRGYLIRKLEKIWDIKNNGRSVWEIVRFENFQGGTTFPVVGRFRAYNDKTLLEERATTLTRLKINGEIPSDAFSLPAIPSGTIVNDFLEGTRYPVDSDWNAIGAKVDNPRQFSPSSESGEGANYSAQTTPNLESQSWTPWLIGLSILLFVAALVAGTVRKKKRSAVEE